MDKIQKFKELIKDHVGSNKTIVDTKVTNLAPGENYMSDMIKIHILLKNEDTGANEDLHVIAKLVIENFMGSTEQLNRNEIIFYQHIIPSIKRFHERWELPQPDFFPNFIAGRYNLTGENEADKNAVLVLENLVEQGYENADRHIGFDLKAAKLVLEDLASFHAVPLAMKLVEPDIFEKETNYFLSQMVTGPPPPPDRPDGPPGDPPHGPPNGPGGGPIIFFKLLLELLQKDNQYSHLLLKYENYMQKSADNFVNPFDRKPVEPFVTIAHADMWINNTMQIYKDGTAIKNKLVDFQMCRLDSPCPDLIFFLFSSVQLSCLREHLDLLIKHYYETFTNILKKVNCYGPQFSFDRFLEEMKRTAPDALFQPVFMMSSVIFKEKGQVHDMEKEHLTTLDDIPPIAKEKLVFLISEAAKRSWI